MKYIKKEVEQSTEFSLQDISKSESIDIIQKIDRVNQFKSCQDFLTDDVNIQRRLKYNVLNTYLRITELYSKGKKFLILVTILAYYV